MTKKAPRACLYITCLTVFSILACNLPSVISNSPSRTTRSLPTPEIAGLPGLSAFSELASITHEPVTARVGPQAGMITLPGGGSLQIFANAFTTENQLQVVEVDLALDRLAWDVAPGKFYVVSTGSDVASLGALVVLDLPRPEGDVFLAHYERGTWVPLPVNDGPTVQIVIDHFSTGEFGLLEFLAQSRMEAELAADSMDNNAPPDRMRQRIEQGDQWTRAFFGVDEAAAQTTDEMCTEIKAVLQQFNSPGNREFPFVNSGAGGMAEFLHSGSAPSLEKGPYYELTEFTVEEIDDRLLATEGQVSPAEFLRIAIEAAGGNIPKGVLAAHNYLKDITYRGRVEYKPGQNVAREYGEPVSHLLSWRSQSNISPAGEYDKMGPLYHIFAAMTGGLWLPTGYSGPTIQAGEALLRTFRHGQDRPDLPKHAADSCGAEAAAWLRKNPPEAATPEGQPEPGEVQPPPAGQVITVTGQLVPTGIAVHKTVTGNTISITYQDDGKGTVTGNAVYAGTIADDQCPVDLVTLIRWELTGQFDPTTGHFSGTLVEYMEGEIAYTNCSIGVVDEFKNGEGGSWEADLVNGVVRGSITLIQSGGVPLERATFEAR